jgi:sporulation protein YqfC
MGRISFEDMADMLDIPGQVLPGVPRITLTGRRRVLVENHGGIVRYSGELIELGGKTRVIIRGSGLTLLAMNASDMVISGDILSAEYA